MRVTDPLAIKALTHPLRLDLLELLASTGPATAAHCGRLLGVPQANCSFHLRQLAKYGFVEEAEPGGDRRERQWRVVSPRPTIKVDSGDDHLLRRQLERVVIDRETAAIRAYADREQHESSGCWRGALGITSGVVSLSPEEAAELRAKWTALLAPYAARDEGPRPGRRHVRYFFAATPLGDDR
ncbi:winged helix-turn-helix domain-containing protein [Asanoa sp. WMMD1127]|uniref:winged helix-turn-helix domain-containing protein n=1 Tax=Asanoa sp. WMMD1127 TaxID=3016107 RepID=UPI002416981B|nr:winged helix-turn-helix domain-containing protein [Asanoa sp. WMMD1127]MDG4826669.1 winged helix-turn-helix domain-containing protein [Asanoa sp. WMMD1127]